MTHKPCTINYWGLLDYIFPFSEGKMPHEYCNTYHAPMIPNYTAPPVEMAINFSAEFMITAFISIFVVSLFGILMVEWFDKKFIFFVDTIMKPIDRRYRFVQNREKEIEFWQGI